MNASPKIAVSLYLHGRDLEPEAITALLDTQPTRQHKMGEKRVTKSGKVLTRKQGLWAIEPKLDSVSVDDHVALLLEMTAALRTALKRKHLSLGKLPRVENAYLDIFYIDKKDEASPPEHQFNLSATSIQKLAEFGVPISFTIGY